MRTESTTIFNPKIRSNQTQLEQDISFLCDHPLVTQLLKSLSTGIVVINENREIIASNTHTYEGVAQEGISKLIGKRPGEVFSCRFALSSNLGCGANNTCKDCGAFQAIQAIENGDRGARKEWNITRQRNGTSESLVFDIHSAPLVINERRYILLTFFDIGKQKHQETLQRTFFHDILNSITGLSGIAHLIKEADGMVDGELLRMLQDTTAYLEETVNAQRDLLAMNTGTFEPKTATTTVASLFNRLSSLIKFIGVHHSRTVLFQPVGNEVTINVDEVLLIRVIINMIKNALEAVPAGATVTVRFESLPTKHIFEVANPGEIPDEIIPRIFEKYYSTKGGTGRGIGTWGMKMIGERYLGGTVDFVIHPDQTIFYITLPR